MKIVRAVLLSSLCMLPIASTAMAQTAGCGDGSTLKDTYSPEDTRRAEQFLLDLRSALNANDKREVASMVQYPVRVNLPNHTHRSIRTKQQFLSQFDWIFNARARGAIQKQAPACMFANAQGAMIGDGEVWFQEEHGSFKIWSFNRM